MEGMIIKPVIRHSVCQMLCMLVFVGIVSASHIEWEDFLKNPNGTTYGTLVHSLKSCDKTAKCIEATPNAGALYDLLALVKSGNPHAVDVAILSLDLDLLDGGHLEDAIRALGQLAETYPKLLLSCLQKHKFTGYPFESIFVMLPLETVDDVGAKIRTVQKRIDSLSRVSDPLLKKERDNAILVLKQELGELQRIKRELQRK
jgi:hypothetical protein